jgi:hypothetical protein
VEEVTRANLELSVRNGSATVYRAVRPCTIFPRRDARLTAARARPLALLQGDGKVLSFLRRGGLEPMLLNGLDEVGTVDADLLVVGAHALDGAESPSEAAERSLNAFLTGGGTLLAFEQDAPPAGLLPVEVTDRPATMGFAHPELGGPLIGLPEGAFRFWRGDNMVARRSLSRPRGGGFRVFVDAGGPEGLERVLLLEVLRGRGRFILCQMLIAEKLGREPMADLMLEKLVNYAAGSIPERRPAGLVRGQRALEEDLRSVGAAFEDLTGRLATADLSPYAVLVVDGSSEEAARAKERLQAFVEGGGRALLHGLTEEALRRLSPPLPAGLSVRPTIQTPVVFAERDPQVTAGLSNQDLHWFAERVRAWGKRHPLSTDVLHGELTRRPPLVECSIIEAEAMAASPRPRRGVAAEGGELHMWRRAWAETRITLPATGRYCFGVVGRGVPAGKHWPEVAVYLDEKLIGRIDVGGPEADAFAITARAEAGPHRLRLGFDSTEWIYQDGLKREVWLDKVFYAACPSGPEQALLRPAGLVKIPAGKGFYLIDQVAWDGRAGSHEGAARYLAGLLTNLGVAFPAQP